MKVITVSLNGESREVPEDLTLAGLVKWLGLPEDQIAVERNLEIVYRPDWENTPIHAGDRIEVVHFVGGGMV
jgi:thiamine biosynthesis protein ThiS